MVLRSSRMRWYGHVERSKGWIAQVRKLNIVAQKRSGKPRKSWDEVLLDDRKKLGMDTADPQNRSEWRGRLRRRLVKQVQPSVEDYKTDMMMMMMITMMGPRPRCYIPSFVEIWFWRRFLKVFAIYSHGGHLGHVTWPIYINFCSPFLRMLHMKLSFDWPSSFRGKDL